MTDEALPIDPETNRPIGDHGTAADAIDFALDHEGGDCDTFLRRWREGDAASEWPDFYEWLAKRERQRG